MPHVGVGEWEGCPDAVVPYWLVSNGLEWSTRFPAGLADDCDVGKTGKKACKNCSCGRAEMEEQGVKLTADMLENPQSACGNVSQGVKVNSGLAALS